MVEDKTVNGFEAAIAFNRAYRTQWQEYMERLSHREVNTLLSALIAGMDDESRAICLSQASLAHFCFPHPILKFLSISPDAQVDLLPEKTLEALTQMNVVGSGSIVAAEKLSSSLDLPLPILMELLTGSGLAYISQQAKVFVANRTVIDGGAYIGDTAVLFVKEYGAAKVWAFEPHLSNFNIMTEYVGRWGLKKKILPICAGLGKVSIDASLWGSGMGASTIQKHGQSSDIEQKMNVVSIDDFVNEAAISDIGFIKLDVEGAEFDAVIGAKNTISSYRPLLIISIYHTARDFFQIKPLIESWNLRYDFMVRRLTADLIKEFVLICIPR